MLRDGPIRQPVERQTVLTTGDSGGEYLPKNRNCHVSRSTSAPFAHFSANCRNSAPEAAFVSQFYPESLLLSLHKRQWKLLSLVVVQTTWRDRPTSSDELAATTKCGIRAILGTTRKISERCVSSFAVELPPRPLTGAAPSFGRFNCKAGSGLALTAGNSRAHWDRAAVASRLAAAPLAA